MRFQGWAREVLAAGIIFSVFFQAFSAVAAPSAVEPVSEKKRHWAVGMGLLCVQSPYRDADRRTLSIPMVTFEGEMVSIQGPRISSAVYKTEAQKLSLVAEYRWDGFQESDSGMLQAMAERRSTVDMGLEYSRRFRYAMVSVAALADVLSRYRGWELRTVATTLIPVKKFFFSPYVGISFYSHQLTGYYYGVRAAEAIAGRPEYEPGAVMNGSAGLRIGYRWADNWLAVCGISQVWLGTEIGRSPIVDDTKVFGIQSAVLYRF